ncbi:MAG: hypothetical protein LKJ03_10755 [Enterococcaceae bacterium]|jgi:hypothetical protein|nr:hypothetical protein [Enterococcaceae bacterium]MCI1918510.1 hypothetical protein [Enterococcaceae bacterium]
MKQIDSSILDCQEVLDYAHDQFVSVLDDVLQVAEAFQKRVADAKSEVEYEVFTKQLTSLAEELERLTMLEQQSQYTLEILEQIKERDYQDE